jgi:hypothetical protein
LNIVSGPVTVKHQLKHSGDVFRKYRSDKVSALGEINSNNRGVFEQEKRRLLRGDVQEYTTARGMCLASLF